MRASDRATSAGSAHWRAIKAVPLLLPLLIAGCDEGRRTSQSTDPGTPGTTITLSLHQLAAIKIETIRRYAFPVEVHAIGSVSFADDPALVQAEYALLGADATYDLTRKELARVRSLGTANGIPQKELEQAISDEQTANAALRAARSAIRSQGKTEAAINHMLKSGKIEAQATYRGTKWVIVSVSESDSTRLRVGEPIFLNAPAAAGRQFLGSVSEIYATVDPTSHRRILRAQVGDTDDLLRPGMLVEAAIEIGKPDVTLGTPESAIVREGDGTMTAWVTSDRKNFSQRVVTTGLRQGGRVQILKGLRDGDQIVSDGAIFLDNMINAVPSD